MSSTKTIWVQPGELVFSQVHPMQMYSQTLQLQNTLSAPVDLTIKSSNSERLECNPKQFKLAPRETIQIDVTFKQVKAFPAKSTKQTETLFIKSDFFDQKVNVIIYPSQNQSSPKAGNSLLQNTGTAFGQKNNVPQQYASRQSRRTDQTGDNRDLMELAGESFGRGSQQHVLQSPQQYLRPDLTGGSNEEDMRGVGSDFERDSASAQESRKQIPQDLKSRLTELTNENVQLKQFLVESQAQLAKQHQQADESQLIKIRAILREKEPNLDELLLEAMKHERLNQEKKDKKVLEILQFKDQQIEELSLRLKDSDDAMVQLKLKHEQKLRETQLTLDKMTEKVQLFENEEKFQELLMSQDLVHSQSQQISQLELELKTSNLKMMETENSKLFYDDMIKKLKSQLEERNKVFAELRDHSLKEEQIKQTLQFTVDEMKVQLNKQSTSNQILTKERQLEFILQQTEQERDEYVNQVGQIKGFMVHLNSILGRVTGEDGSVTADSQSNVSKQSQDIESKLEQRAEEIVGIVEQVQNQYTLLEQEMRALIEMKSSETNSMMRMKSKHFDSKVSDKIIKTMESNKLQTDEEWTHRASQNNLQNQQSEHNSSKQLQLKIAELKDREKQLLDQLSYMKEQLKFQTSNSDVTIDQAQFTQDHAALRVQELETLIFQQREQILTLKTEISNLRGQLDERDYDMKNQLELLSLRNKNLQELNKKFENSSQCNDLMGSGNFGTFNFTSPTMKSTAVETERVRQYAQQLELANLDLKHKLEENQAVKVQAVKQVETMKAKAKLLDHELANLQQEQAMRRVGLTPSDSKMAILVQELRQKITRLESQKSASEPTTQCFNSGRQMSVAESQASLALNQLQGSSLFALKEEYCTKLEKLVELNASDRSQLQNQVSSYSQKNDKLHNKVKVLEDKEVKWYMQSEELKSQLQVERDTNQTKLKELEKLLQQKSYIVFDLEREVKKKEKMLSERQEQLSILLSAMEQTANNADDPMQNVANMAAELCSMKAVEAQMERKVNDLLHLEKQAQMQVTKLQTELQDYQNQVVKLQRQNKTLESSNELLERQKYDLSNHFEEIKRDQNESKYKQERMQFQIKIKEETIENLKNQFKQAEVYFREQIDRIREDTQQVKPSPQLENRYRREVAMKHAIQQLHLVIADYIDRQSDEDPKRSRTESAQHKIIQEMEKALKVAQETITKLENDLDKERFRTSQLQNDWDTQVLNNILVMRQEKLTAQVRVLNNLIEERELEGNRVIRCQSEAYSRVIKDIECRADNQTKLLQQSDDENSHLSQKVNTLVTEREELLSSVLCFQQELANQKQSLELKAQMTVDERHKAKNDAIKVYFESQVSKILMTYGSTDSSKIQQISQEVIALQLLVENQKKQVEQLKSAMQSSDMNLKFYREQLSQEESKSRDLSCNLQQGKEKLNGMTVGLKIELNQKKQEILQLEKELICSREAMEHKARENVSLLQRVESNRAGDLYEREISYLKQRVDGSVNESELEMKSNKVQHLQEQLMDIRGCHIQELDDLKLQFDLEIAEAKRDLTKKKFELEKRYLPGSTPGELVDQNSELRQFNQQLQEDLEQLLRERDQMRQQLDELLYQVEGSKEDTQSYQQALQELQSALLGRAQPQLKMASEQKKLKKSTKAEHPLEMSQLQTFDKFQINPPTLVKELIKAKQAENNAKIKLREHLIVESKLRQQLTQNLGRENLKEKSPDNDEVINQLMQQNQNILSLLNFNVPDSQMEVDNQELCPDDQTLLVKTIVYLVEQITCNKEVLVNQKQMLERVPLTYVVEAQRIVIRALSANHKNKIKIDYIPEREIDRKIWYLELLEQQVFDAEKQTTNLQEFVKRLQIGVSGNLQSAAEIKATSMDLAQNLKAASDEVKSLRHIAGLIKHDVLSQQTVQDNKQTIINPFIDAENTQRSNRFQDTQRSNFDKLVNENESMQNQLSLTSKVKQSIEQELINAKLQHATELQTLISKFARAERQLNQALDETQKNKGLLQNSQLQLEQAHQEIESLSEQLQLKSNQFDKQKTDIVKSKDTSKNLQQLRSDMQDYKKQSESNLKAKQDQIRALQDQLAQLGFDKEKLKVEVQMLRKSQKAIREGHELNRVEEENKALQKQLDEQVDERKQEIDFWVQERAIMRERIEKLESQTQNIQDKNTQSDNFQEIQQKCTLLAKKLKTKDYEIKSMQTEIIQVKDQLAQANLNVLNFEQKLRDEQQKTQDAGERLKLVSKRQKEVEIERDLLAAQSRKQHQKNDTDANQVGYEIESLRQEFVKVKFEKDNLVDRIELSQRKEVEFNQTIERLQSQVTHFQSNQVVKNSDQENQIKTLEQKNTALLADLKYLRIENEKLQNRLKEAQNQVLDGDAQTGKVTQEMQTQFGLIEDCKRRILDAEAAIKQKAMRIIELESELVQNETSSYNKIKKLQDNLSLIKNEATQAQQIFAAQIQTLKAIKLSDKAKPTQSKEIELTLMVSQKDTVVKQQKKELAQFKTQVAKLKSKTNLLKDQIDTINQKPTQPVEKNAKNSKEKQQVVPQTSLFEQILIEKLTNAGGLKNFVQQLKHVNRLEVQVTDAEQTIVKLENWNTILTQQIEELQGMQEDKDELIVDLKLKQKEIKKDKLGQYASNEKMLRDQLKMIKQELDQTRNEWLSPQAVKEQVELVGSLQQQLKSLQNEVNRKGKMVSQLKSFKEAQDEETNLFLNNMNELKDDYAKQQKIIKEFQKRDNQTKDLRSQIEWLQKQEKTAKEEVISLSDKLRQTKTDLARKDQVVKEYRDRLEMRSEDTKVQKVLRDEIEKLKDQSKKLKLDAEIKENQVKVLKQRLESNQEEMMGLSNAKQDLRSHESQFDSKLKTQKAKASKLETVLRKTIQALTRIGGELVNSRKDQNAKIQKTQTPSQVRRDEPLKFGELQKDAEYYKDSVEILGLGFNELETFLNPQQKGIKPYEARSNSRLTRNASSVSASQETLIERLDRLEYLLGSKGTSSEMQEEIDQIEEFCLKLIAEITK